jgi:formylglycine-generating enzyme required for sulfatase activity
LNEKYALIIANTEYTDPGLAQLTAPGKDAKEFARVLDSPEICAFNDVIILFNENASKVSETIDYFLSSRKPSDLLVLYFSGHGVRDEYGSLYLAVKNTNRERLRSTAIKSDFIREAMDQSRSKRQVLILDCCNSGAFAQGTKAEIGGSVGTASAFEGTGYGRVVLTASDSTQFAWEGDRVIGATENSLFTHFLVKGMEGDADTNGDGRITIDELYDYAYEQIVNITPKQTPGKWSYKQQGEILLRQNIRIEDAKPAPLPEDLLTAINSAFPYIRESAVSQLDLLLKSKNLGLARSASLALEKIAAEDDSRRVAEAAAKALERSQRAQKELQTAGRNPSTSSRTGQLRREKMEQEIRFQAEKSELEKRLHEAQEIIDTQQKIKAVEQTTATRAPVRWFGIAVAALIILGIGYAAIKFLPGLSKSAPTETSIPTNLPTEVPVAAPGTGQSSPTPTVTPATTASAIPNGTATLQAESTDGKSVERVLVQAGDFSMGSNTSDALDEKPAHTVFLDGYYIDKFEVRNAQYKACVEAGKCDPPKHPYFFPESPSKIYYGNAQYDNYPVVYVDWNMAKDYCEWRGASLPTEAQWEKAARGGTDERIYPWGDDLQCRQANYLKCVNHTSAVGSYGDGKSLYGAYDMAGNVLEWVADWYSANYYENLFSSNPTGPISGQSRVVRGGSWTKYDVRVSNRVGVAPNSATFDIGFRCVSSLP